MRGGATYANKFWEPGKAPYRMRMAGPFPEAATETVAPDVFKGRHVAGELSARSME